MKRRMFSKRAADYLIVPNPYLALGADLVAYSGGKILRGPKTAGLLLGRKDLVRAAWANSAPHPAFGRAMKVRKEEIVGMVVAVDTFVNKRNMQSEFSGVGVLVCAHRRKDHAGARRS